MLNALLNIGLAHFLVMSLVLFLIGLFGVLVSRNMLRTVMSLFIMSVSAVINFAAFGYYCDSSMENANMISVFVLILTVIQTIIALVILYKIYQANESLDAEKIKDKEN